MNETVRSRRPCRPSLDGLDPGAPCALRADAYDADSNLRRTCTSGAKLAKMAGRDRAWWLRPAERFARRSPAVSHGPDYRLGTLAARSFVHDSPGGAVSSERPVRTRHRLDV